MTRYTPSHALPRPVRAPSPHLPARALVGRLRRPARRLAMGALILAMAMLSIALWIASPLAWLWIAAHVTDSSHPGLGPYALLLAGILFTTIVLTRLLGSCDREYQRLAHAPNRRLHRSWLRSSGQQKLERPQAGPIGVVMAVSVLVALIALIAVILLSGHPFEPIPFMGAR